MSLNIGDTLGQYRIDAEIGGGGFATVYKGYQASFDRPVAIKVPLPQFLRNRSFVERFRREAEATFSLKHPNIVEVYDFQEMDGMSFMVMEYVDGASLRDVLIDKGAFDARTGEEDATRLREEEDATRLHEQGDGTRLHELDTDVAVMKNLTGKYEPLPVGIVAQIAKDVCAALTYAHEQGVFHRDLKPDNVLIAKDGRALLSDFGIARVQEESRLTRTGAAMGTLAYMSPEQFSKANEASSRTDIYSLGVMLYELLTGSVPFVGVDSEVLQKHLNEKPLRPRTVRGEIPVVMEEVVMKCLEKKPQDRFQTTEEVSNAILAETKPLPLTALFGSDTGTGGSTNEKERTFELICPQCGVGFSEKGETTRCPGCGEKNKRRAAEEEVEKRVLAGRQFIMKFKFPLGVEMPVKAYQYQTEVKPSLLREYDETLKIWAASLEKGSVVAPTMGEGEWPEGEKIITTIKKILDFKALWDSEALNEYVVKIGDKRERKKQMAGLEGRAYQLLGFLQSLGGARGQTNEEMISKYAAARGWFERSEKVLKDAEPELASVAGFSKQFTDVILQFPVDPRGALPKIEIQPDQAPGVKVDLGQCHEYEGVLDRIEGKINRLKGEAQTLLNKVKDQIDQITIHLEEYKKEVENQMDLHQKKSAQIKGKSANEISRLEKIIQISRWTILFLPWAAGLIGLIISGLKFDRSGLAAFGLMSLALSLGFLYVRLPGMLGKPTWWDASPIVAGILGLVLVNKIIGALVAVLGIIGLWLAGSRWGRIRHSNPFARIAVTLMAAIPAIYIQIYTYMNFIMPGSKPVFLLPEIIGGFFAGIIVGGVYRNRKPKLDSANDRLKANLSKEFTDHQMKIAEIDSRRLDSLNLFKTSSDKDISTVVAKLEEAELQASTLSLRFLRSKTPQELAKTDELRSYANELNSNRSLYIQVEEIPIRPPEKIQGRVKR
jgi:serine/threonine protein kinase